MYICSKMQTIEIPFLKVTKKVKSMQMFHKPVQSAMQVHNTFAMHTVTPSLVLAVWCGVIQGDRVGICVTQFDPKQVERCLVASPGHLPTLEGGWVSL